MKKNWWCFLISLIVCIFCVLAIVTLPLHKWPKEPGQPFVAIIFLWTIQIIAAIILGWAMKSFRPKPNYSWKEIREKNSFKIITVSSEFKKMSMEENCEDFMEVEVKKFGKTLVSFPTYSYFWQNGYPEPGQTWNKYGRFFFLIYSCEEPC
ncbi:hypothetical protein HXX01_02080 [Candidatus Nomurabacteria bacterium]|nr:hypothetical protein [Candidatus Nomurabacteria bacterium]